VKPVVTVPEMRDIDREAQARVPLERLIQRAGAAVARSALALMGGAYGRRVVVVAGPGHNGDDGRVAARLLHARGARVAVLDAAPAPERLAAGVDLVIDAAYGTGFRGVYAHPTSPAPVLAVDIWSGLDAATGQSDAPEETGAAHTVTFAALKAGLLLGRGPQLSGRVEVADIGLDCSRARQWLIEDADVAAAGLGRAREAHKWQTALGVVAGSPGMMGAPGFCVSGAQRAGAGMVRLGVPGAGPGDLPATEAVSVGLPASEWGPAALDWTARCRALVVGPGLGRGEHVSRSVRGLLTSSPLPAVVDADGLAALGRQVDAVLSSRPAPTVLTPHDGEFEVLTGSRPGPDRMAAAAALARSCRSVVLLKGSTTVVAEPEGRVLLCASGSSRLATAGTGDVLSGVIGALLAQGVEPGLAAALAAHVHGRAAGRGRPVGLVARDLPDLVSDVLADLVAA
jgi:hydroxyethylthiazole kinase-like uncharacterized protein yjeF